MRKKVITLMLCVTMVASLLAGCGKSTADDTDNAKSKDSSAAAPTAEGTEEASQAFSGQELSILVSAGWMDNRYDATISRFEEAYGVTVDLQTIPADQYSDILKTKLSTGTCRISSGFNPTPLQLNHRLLRRKNTAWISRVQNGRALC